MSKKKPEKGSHVWYFVATRDRDIVLRTGVVDSIETTLGGKRYKVKTMDEPEDSPYKDSIYLIDDTIFMDLAAARRGLIKYLTKEIAHYRGTKKFFEAQIKRLKKIRTREKYWDNMAKTAKRLKKEQKQCS